MISPLSQISYLISVRHDQEKIVRRNALPSLPLKNLLTYQYFIEHVEDLGSQINEKAPMCRSEKCQST